MSGRLLGRSGALAGADFAIAATLRIGSAADVDRARRRAGRAAVARDDLARRRSRLLLTAERRGRGRLTCLNGRRVTSEPLQHLDVITIGGGVDLIYLAT